MTTVNESFAEYASVSPCDYADAVGREQFMHHSIRPLYSPIARIAGPAFTVECAPGDHLMLHAAVYEAMAGDIIVAKGDPNFALAGGNVCAIAKKRGIAGFVIDGVIRDLSEVRAMQFPVFALGVMPKPGAKKIFTPLNQPVQCAGVEVMDRDIIIADEEGIVVLPSAQSIQCRSIAQARAQKDASLTLDEWQHNHYQTVVSKLELAKAKKG